MKKMRLVFAVILIGGFISCEDSQGGGLVYNPDDGGIVGSGVDPGKAASTCYPAFADNELNVATWNIEFLSTTNTDLSKVKSIVENLDADIIAIQEINSISSFNSLANSLPEWQGYSVDIGGSLDLGFLVKTDAFTSIGPIDTDFNTLLRPAVKMTVTHASGIEVTLFNIHLKCCGDGRDQRIAASNTMKSILDSDYPGSAIILLGDFNDEIHSTDSPFQNFKDDSSDYRFADIGVALGSGDNFSYPCTGPSYCPSHIDHILISDELFDKVGLVQTIKPESCVNSYSQDVSDHRPVLASFK